MAFEEMRMANSTENWCVIMQSYSPKLKKELVRKLVDVFDLEKKDAEQALSNTPLILLDNLSFGMAARIKNFFSKTGAVAETTNHDMIKKNCYQILWPSTPDLSFFLKEEVAASSEKGSPQAEKVKASEKIVPAPEKDEPKKSLFEKLKSIEKKSEEEPAPEKIKTPEKDEPKKSLFEKLKSAEKKSEEKPAPTLTPAPVKDAKKEEPKKPIEKPQPVEVPKPSVQPVVPEKKKDEAATKKLEEQRAVALKESEALKVRCSQMEKSAKDLEVKLAEKDDLLKDTEGTLSLTRQRVSESATQIKKLQEQLASKDQRMGEKDSNLASLKEWESKAKSLGEALAVKEKECSEAHATIAEWQKELANFEDFLTKKEHEHATLKTGIEEKESKLMSLEERLAAREKERSVLHAAIEEWETKVTELERRLAEKEKDHSSVQDLHDSLEDKVAELEGSLVAKDNEIATLHSAVEEAQEKAASWEDSIASLQTKEADAANQAEALRRSLTELNNSLRNSEEALKSRDTALVTFEKKIEDLTAQNRQLEKIRHEHDRLAAEQLTLRKEFEVKFTEQEARIAKNEEENRRYRSRTERKIAAATRELGEWVRGVDALRQGLQKLTVFIGSDAAVPPTEKKLVPRAILNKPTKPPENKPQ